MDGMDLLRTIRRAKYTPILALTEPLSIDDEIALFRAGADAFLRKPVNIQLCKAQANALIQLYIASGKNRSRHAPIIYGEEFILIPHPSPGIKHRRRYLRFLWRPGVCQGELPSQPNAAGHRSHAAGWHMPNSRASAQYPVQAVKMDSTYTGDFLVGRGLLRTCRC